MVASTRTPADLDASRGTSAGCRFGPPVGATSGRPRRRATSVTNAVAARMANTALMPGSPHGDTMNAAALATTMPTVHMTWVRATSRPRRASRGRGRRRGRSTQGGLRPIPARGPRRPPRGRSSPWRERHHQRADGVQPQCRGEDATAADAVGQVAARQGADGDGDGHARADQACPEVAEVECGPPQRQGGADRDDGGAVEERRRSRPPAPGVRRGRPTRVAGVVMSTRERPAAARAPPVAVPAPGPLHPARSRAAAAPPRPPPCPPEEC